jgi:hypothetical protein
LVLMARWRIFGMGFLRAVVGLWPDVKAFSGKKLALAKAGWNPG